MKTFYLLSRGLFAVWIVAYLFPVEWSFFGPVWSLYISVIMFLALPVIVATVAESTYSNLSGAVKLWKYGIRIEVAIFVAMLLMRSSNPISVVVLPVLLIISAIGLFISEWIARRRIAKLKFASNIAN